MKIKKTLKKEKVEIAENKFKKVCRTKRRKDEKTKRRKKYLIKS